MTTQVKALGSFAINIIGFLIIRVVRFGKTPSVLLCCFGLGATVFGCQWLAY